MAAWRRSGLIRRGRDLRESASVKKGEESRCCVSVVYFVDKSGFLTISVRLWFGRS